MSTQSSGSCEVCGAPTTKACGACKVVFYCSRAHQLEARRFHRKECSVEAAIARGLASLERERRAAPPDATCLYCLEHDDKVLHQGCACRGTAGCAHVECAFEGRQPPEEQPNTCDVCKTPPTGVFGLRLATAYWRLHRRGKLDNLYAWKALSVLGSELRCCEENEAALELRRANYNACRSQLPAGNLLLIAVTTNLSRVLMELGRADEARTLLEPYSDAWRTAVDDDDRGVKLRVSLQYALCLLACGQVDEAERLVRMALNAAKNLFGKDHTTTLEFKSSLCDVLRHQGKWREYNEQASSLLEAVRRIYGPDHGITKTHEALFTRMGVS